MVLIRWVRRHWLQIMVHAGALLPLAWLLWSYARGAFLVDPIREITTLTGKTALVLLLLSLACTPTSTITGFSQVLRVRRALGLYAFMYAGLHFLTFVGLDYRFDPGLIGPAILEQRYVLAGMAAGLVLLPLALTSTRGWQRRLGKNWKRLHRLVYLAGILTILHFMWQAKDIREPLRFGVVLAVLLVLRHPRVREAVSHLRRRIAARTGPPARPGVTT